MQRDNPNDGSPLLASWFVRLDGEAAPRWIRRDALEEEREERAFPEVGARVRVNQGVFRGRWGSVQQVDPDLGEVLVALTGRGQPIWFLVEAVDAWPMAERLKSSAPDRYRIAPGWSGAGRIGVRVAPDVEVGGTFYVPLVWEDEVGSGARPVYVLKCTLVPAVTPPKPKNERLRGMIYLSAIPKGVPLLKQGDAILSGAQYDEVVRRSNAWGQLERLYQRICGAIYLTAPSVREELGRIVKGVV